jgi:hypothetical protein
VVPIYSGGTRSQSPCCEVWEEDLRPMSYKLYIQPPYKKDSLEAIRHDIQMYECKSDAVGENESRSAKESQERIKDRIASELKQKSALVVYT